MAGFGTTGSDQLVPLLQLIRRRRGNTRPALARLAGLGRTVVAQRVGVLMEAGLVTEEGLDLATGGRPSRSLRFNSALGAYLVAALGATTMNAAITDLDGNIVEHQHEEVDIAAGPEVVLALVERTFESLSSKHPTLGIWGIGIGLPGPVEFATGCPTSPPIMPGWDRFPVRSRLSNRFNAPTWVDNDVNILAMGELSRGLALNVEDAIFVKIGTGIGAGLISHGHLHRGAQGAAGDIGHVLVAEDTKEVCRCGKLGCLEALASGHAIALQGEEAARSGMSPFLARLLEENQAITSRDVSEAANHGDRASREILSHAGRLVGQTIAAMVNFYNPSLVIVGGGVTNAGDTFLASIRQSIYTRSLPLATRDLRIPRSDLGDLGGIYGAAAMVSDEILSADLLPQWIDRGNTAGMPELPLLSRRDS